MTKQPQLVDLMQQVGYHLTGRWVTFELYNGPQYRVAGEVAYGCTRKDLDGRPVITLKGNQYVQDFLHCFLHELGHVVDPDFELMPASKMTPSQAMTIDPLPADPSPAFIKATGEVEDVAEVQATKWLDYCHCHTVEWNNLAACLKVLLEMPKEKE